MQTSPPIVRRPSLWDDLVSRLHVAARVFVKFGANAVANIIHRDCVLEYPGENPFAGTYRGRAAVLELFRDLQDRTRGTLDVKILGIEREPGGLVVTHGVTAGSGTRAIETVDWVHIRFRHGLIDHIRVEFEDQARWDEFLRPHA